MYVNEVADGDESTDRYHPSLQLSSALRGKWYHLSKGVRYETGSISTASVSAALGISAASRRLTANDANRPDSTDCVKRADGANRAYRRGNWRVGATLPERR